MFVNFNFSDFINEMIEEYTIEIKTGNNIQKQIIQAPPEMAKRHFIDLSKQAYQSNQPIRIRFYKDEEIYNQYRNETKTLNYYIQFANNIYMKAFEEEFKDNVD